jgi:hypothetical protein
MAMTGATGPSSLGNQLNVANNQSLDQSGWSFYAFVRNEPGQGGGGAGGGGSRNPHKAVFSLDAKTSRILIANKLGCR